ncbi:hypothetical protein JCM3770_003367 [Rhodotorula araucariae]
MAARSQPEQSAPRPDELTPRQLADAWKKDGGFDRLRKQLLHDFLASPEKDALLADLDSLLPTLLATTTSLARHPRQARLAETTTLLEKRGQLSAPVVHLENRLRSGKGVGRSVESELRRVMCEKKGLPYEEVKEDDSEEQPAPPLIRPEPARPGKEDAAQPAVEQSAPVSAQPVPSPAADPSNSTSAVLDPPHGANGMTDHDSLRPAPLEAPSATSATTAEVEPAPLASAAEEDVEMEDAAAPAAPAAVAPEDAHPAVQEAGL